MRFRTPRIASMLAIALCCGLSGNAVAKNKELRFLVAVRDTSVCLDIVGNKQRTTPTVQQCGDYSGQAWWLEDTKEAPYVKLKNYYSGVNLCLDIDTSRKSHIPVMADCGNFTGQYWKLEANTTSKDFKLKNTFSGETLCLELFAIGGRDQLAMAPCKNLTGQMWRNELY